MSHRVLIQPPAGRGVYVTCGDLDECLTVVEEEAAERPAGTRITMIRKRRGQPTELLAVWHVGQRGVRRYRINADAPLSFGEHRHVAGMPAYWWRRGEDPVQVGFRVPASFSRKTMREMSESRRLVEEIFEEERQESFATHPSRIGARFVCPSLEGFCKHRGRTYHVLVTGHVFMTDGVNQSEAYYRARHDDIEGVRSWADSYWRGRQIPYGLPEIVVQGEVEVVGEVEGREVNHGT